MTARPLVGVVVSAVFHGVLLAGVLVVMGRDAGLPALMIDLTDGDGGRAAPAAGDDAPAGSGQRRSAAAPSRPAARPAIRPARPSALAPDVARTRVEDVARTRAEDIAPPRADEPPPSPPPPVAPAAPPNGVASTAPAPPSGPAASAPSSTGDRAGGGAETGGKTATGRGADADGARGGRGAGRGAGEGGGTAVASVGTGRAGAPGGEYAGYLARFRQHVQETLRYPPAARRRGLAGTVHVEVVILPTGAVGPVAVVRSSTHALLDEAAVATVRALPVLPFPLDVPARLLRVRLPVVFELR